MRLLLTGDSLLARREDAHGPLINKALLNRRPSIKIDNTAIGGDQTPDLLRRAHNDVVIRPHADWVFILIGTNDAAAHKLVPLPEFTANVQQIMDQVGTVYAGARVVMITPPPVDERRQRTRSNARIREYGRAIQQVARQHGARVLDLYQLFMREPNLAAVVDGSLHDGLHFGKYGYGILADACWRWLMVR
ncbi:GDSL-type esterase/lipase family protein [Lacticaseibacillus pantheris]|uniref:GDSL-type esterase/lipase family protein n=1 Tax=Lacticaseibacillus pantheris TaxID=171523 RepID=UPI0006D1E01F|nr:GDSL-type esterase/lipase family protein [Lacticaseibacillus pantheris]